MVDDRANASTFHRSNEAEGSEEMQTVDVAAGGLRGILDALLKVEGGAAAGVVGGDGFAIESVSSNPVDTDSVAAIAASSLTAAEAMGEALKLGTMGSILIEYELGPVAVTPAGPEAVLAVVGNHGANLGRVAIDEAEVRPAVARALCWGSV